MPPPQADDLRLELMKRTADHPRLGLCPWFVGPTTPPPPRLSSQAITANGSGVTNERTVDFGPKAFSTTASCAEWNRGAMQ
jgi:hypothetical protein